MITKAVLLIQCADLILSGPVIFTKIKSCGLINTKDSQVYLHYYVELSLSQVAYIFDIRHIILKENSKLNVSKNKFALVFLRTDNEMSVYREGYEDV